MDRVVPVAATRVAAGDGVKPPSLGGMLCLGTQQRGLNYDTAFCSDDRTEKAPKYGTLRAFRKRHQVSRQRQRHAFQPAHASAAQATMSVVPPTGVIIVNPGISSSAER